MKPKAIFLLPESSWDRIYGDEHSRTLAKLTNVDPVPVEPERLKTEPDLLKDVQIIFSGWGCPQMTQELLDRAPELKIVFYGAGSVKRIVTDSFWNRGCRITSSYAANAIPVAEFTFAQILLSLKNVWRHSRLIREKGGWHHNIATPGAWGQSVGLISLGMIGRMVAERLKALQISVFAYDPFVSQEQADSLGVQMTDLDDLFGRCRVVSLHTPWLKETEGMITGAHFDRMPKDSVFINTARGAVIKEDEMIQVLKKRPDITAVLDVTYPEPPADDSPLRILDNVFLTPHIAGSQEGECRRMGSYVVSDVERYLTGDTLEWELSKEKAAILA